MSWAKNDLEIWQNYETEKLNLEIESQISEGKKSKLWEKGQNSEAKKFKFLDEKSKFWGTKHKYSA